MGLNDMYVCVFGSAVASVDSHFKSKFSAAAQCFNLTYFIREAFFGGGFNMKLKVVVGKAVKSHVI